MTYVVLQRPNDFKEWRNKARELLSKGIAPSHVEWREPNKGSRILFHEFLESEVSPSKTITASRAFIKMAEIVICYNDTNRFSLLYRLLWRLQNEKNLLNIHSDSDVSQLFAMCKSVKRDAHKMKAFIRFKQINRHAENDDEKIYFAWFEPEHFIVERTAPFFMRRFPNMRWVIATPYRTAIWNRENLEFSKGKLRPIVSDDWEELWLTYYASIFNPARLKIKAMQAEMPKKYWNNLPETQLIPSLIAKASQQVSEMIHAPAIEASAKARKWSAKTPVCPLIKKEDDINTFAEARAAAAHCQRCSLYCNATQTVFGEGVMRPDILFVGEQPGDREDIAGKPFVGPAGQLLDKCLIEAGIERKLTYVTNAVKHFKYVPRGRLRLHRTPNKSEVDACRFWLNLERTFLKPKLIVTLGATAALSVTGKAQKVTQQRGRFFALEDGTALYMTIHPSYLLRLRDDREEQRHLFVEDLKKIRKFVMQKNSQSKLKALAA